MARLRTPIQLRRLRAPGLARPRGRRSQRHAITGGLQPLSQRLADVFLVLDDEQVRGTIQGVVGSRLVAK
jgi:hypothetical protein